MIHVTPVQRRQPVDQLEQICRHLRLGVHVRGQGWLAVCWDHGHVVKTAAGAGDAWTGADNSMRTYMVGAPAAGTAAKKNGDQNP